MDQPTEEKRMGLEFGVKFDFDNIRLAEQNSVFEDLMYLKSGFETLQDIFNVQKAMLVPELTPLGSRNSIPEEWEDWSQVFLLKYGEVFKGKQFRIMLMSMIPEELKNAIKFSEYWNSASENREFLKNVETTVHRVYDTQDSLRALSDWKLRIERGKYAEIGRLEKLVKRAFPQLSHEGHEAISREHLQCWIQQNLPTLFTFKCIDMASYAEVREYLLKYLEIDHANIDSHDFSAVGKSPKFRGKCTKCKCFGHKRKECLKTYVTASKDLTDVDASSRCVRLNSDFGGERRTSFHRKSPSQLVNSVKSFNSFTTNKFQYKQIHCEGYYDELTNSNLMNNEEDPIREPSKIPKSILPLKFLRSTESNNTKNYETKIVSSSRSKGE